MIDAERFNVNHPDLCPCLKWKGLFIQVEPDPSAQYVSDGSFWCVYTQNCLGPDGGLAEPGECSSADRACWGTGKI
jgi:hypothetical protein